MNQFYQICFPQRAYGRTSKYNFGHSDPQLNLQMYGKSWCLVHSMICTFMNMYCWESVSVREDGLACLDSQRDIQQDSTQPLKKQTWQRPHHRPTVDSQQEGAKTYPNSMSSDLSATCRVHLIFLSFQQLLLARRGIH